MLPPPLSDYRYITPSRVSFELSFRSSSCPSRSSEFPSGSLYRDSPPSSLPPLRPGYLSDAITRRFPARRPISPRRAYRRRSSITRSRRSSFATDGGTPLSPLPSIPLLLSSLSFTHRSCRGMKGAPHARVSRRSHRLPLAVPSRLACGESRIPDPEAARLIGSTVPKRREAARANRALKFPARERKRERERGRWPRLRWRVRRASDGHIDCSGTATVLFSFRDPTARCRAARRPG